MFRLRLLCYSCIIVSSEVHYQNIKINPSKEEKEKQFQCDALKVLTLEFCNVNDESEELRGVSRPLQIQQFSPCYSPQNITNSLLKVCVYSGSFLIMSSFWFIFNAVLRVSKHNERVLPSLT